eukprot:971851-Prymnesium_polylepis.2
MLAVFVRGHNVVVGVRSADLVAPRVVLVGDRRNLGARGHVHRCRQDAPLPSRVAVAEEADSSGRTTLQPDLAAA